VLADARIFIESPRRACAKFQKTVREVSLAFNEIVHFLKHGVNRLFKQLNSGLRTVTELAEYIRRRLPNSRGFSAQNLWRMGQFFETYQLDAKLSALLRELPWTHNPTILTACKRLEERAFYLKMAAEQRWSSRQLERQLSAALLQIHEW
jgi:predicted nuclease of restriction endonuclease-like (RecB) superfamily